LTRAPSLQGVLYESAYESQLILLFDRQKKYLGAADAWPEEIKVPKGTITLRMQVRHDKPDMLEKLKDTPIWIERKLEKEIGLSMYTSKESMMIGSETFKRRMLRKGSSCSLFISEPPTSKLPSGSKAGDILTGIVTFESNDSTLPGDGKRPDGFPLTYYLASKPAKNKDPISSVEEKDERSVDQKLEESIRDCKVKFLGKMTKEEKDSGKYDEMYVSLVKEYDGYLPLLLEGLKSLDNEKKRKEHLDKIILAADDIISRISEDELAVHFGKHHDKDNTNAVKEHKDLIEKKTILCEAWARKARALADLDQENEFKEALVALQKWAIVTKEDKYAILILERDRRAKRYGSMIKVLNSLINSSTSNDSAKEGSCPLSHTELISKRIEVYRALEYTPLTLYEEAWRVISAPKSYKLF
jgi:tripeptidyl-peptidase II